MERLPNPSRMWHTVSFGNNGVGHLAVKRWKMTKSWWCPPSRDSVYEIYDNRETRKFKKKFREKSIKTYIKIGGEQAYFSSDVGHAQRNPCDHTNCHSVFIFDVNFPSSQDFSLFSSFTPPTFFLTISLLGFGPFPNFVHARFDMEKAPHGIKFVH